MNGIIGLKEANCKNCYKCIRNCPVKSIAFKDEQMNIMSDECIYCGACLLTCPQNAKYICSDLPKIKQALRDKEKLYVSLAPSYIAAFPDTGILKISAALKKLGFTQVEETAIGAEQVTGEYEKKIREHKMKNIITTACPSVNLLVEKYYPKLIPQLAPVVTPLVAHARMIKQIYGIRAKVVFIGPCISKKYEAQDPDNAHTIFAELTFDELKQWLREENLTFSGSGKGGRTLKNTLFRYYPAPGGIINNLHPEERKAYECLSVDGVDRCIEILDNIARDNLTGYFLELNACSGGCLGGPVLKMMQTSFLKSKKALLKNVKRLNEAPPALTVGVQVQFEKKFRNRCAKKTRIDEEQIKKILALTGKVTADEELNCGFCGYNSCREKAIAVLQNKADIRMCVPYMRELAESMSNAVVENTPTGILIIDENLKIEHINPAAVKLLEIRENMKGQPVDNFLPSEDFRTVLQTGESIVNHKQYYANLDITVEQTVVPVKSSRLIFVLLKDITQEEKMQETQRKVTEETVAFAEDVVNKQMRVVQEIANLLGETTIETKIALSQLTKAVVPEEGDQHGPGD